MYALSSYMLFLIKNKDVSAVPNFSMLLSRLCAYRSMHYWRIYCIYCCNNVPNIIKYWGNIKGGYNFVVLKGTLDCRHRFHCTFGWVLWTPFFYYVRKRTNIICANTCKYFSRTGCNWQPSTQNISFYDIRTTPIINAGVNNNGKLYNRMADQDEISKRKLTTVPLLGNALQKIDSGMDRCFQSLGQLRRQSYTCEEHLENSPETNYISSQDGIEWFKGVVWTAAGIL